MSPANTTEPKRLTDSGNGPTDIPFADAIGRQGTAVDC